MAISSSVSSPEDVCNQALDSIGYARSIADINEGTKAARVALRSYSQARDEALAEDDWSFARARVGLTAPLKAQSGAYAGVWNSILQPPPPWQYEWQLPSDFIRALTVYPVPAGSGIIYDPKPYLWEILDDVQGAPLGDKVLVTQFNNPILTYTSRFLDMNQWDIELIMLVVKKLGVKFTIALKDDPKLFPAQVQLEAKAAQEIATQPI